MGLFGCKSQQFKLENNSDLSLQNGTYVIIPAAIEESASSVEISILLNEFNKDISLNGFYFRDTFIDKKPNKNQFQLEGIVSLNSNSTNKIPFLIEDDEVVVSYNQNKKKKFVKFKLKKKINSLNNIPMENNN